MRESPWPRMAPQALRGVAPAPLLRLPACAAVAEATPLGLERPLGDASLTSSL
jgi:hypothetical protein